MSDLTDLGGVNPPTAWSENQARQDLEALQKSNQDILNSLAREGVGIDGFTMLKMRLDYVTDFLVGDDLERIHEFAMGWESFLAKVLEGAESKVAQAKLAVMPGQLSLVDPR